VRVPGVEWIVGSVEVSTENNTALQLVDMAVLVELALEDFFHWDDGVDVVGGIDGRLVE
jgi:hypothetical protein